MIAIADPTSSVLPYCYSSASELDGPVDLFCSETNYNSQFYFDWGFGKVTKFKISSTTNANLIIRVCNYCRLLLALFSNRRQYDRVYVNFPSILLVDILLFLVLREKLVFVIHNAVPHSYQYRVHVPTLILASVVKRIQVISTYNFNEFKKRYEFWVDSRKIFLAQHPQLVINPVLVPTRSNRKSFFSSGNNIVLTFWGNVKPYKGVKFLLQMCKYIQVNQLPINVEIYGKWDKSLLGVKLDMELSGGVVIDRFISDDEVHQLLQEERIFILPYENASQSGVLYTLLSYGAVFVTTDVGDCGEFVRNKAIPSLLFDAENPSSCLDAINFICERYDKVMESLYG